MDVNALLILVEVVDAGSLAAAARKTGVSKSTLSRKLKELEEELGVRLLERTPRKLGLTEPGRTLVEGARRVAEELDHTKRLVRSLGQSPRGTVRVTTSVSFAERYLTPIVPEFLTAHPDVDLELLLDASVTDLVTEEIDLAIRIGAPDSKSTMIARRITKTSAYLCASPDYLRRHGAPAEVGDIADHDCIVYRPGREPLRWVLESPGGEQFRIRPRSRMTVNSHPMCVAACGEGQGIAMIPVPLCIDGLESGQLVRLLAPIRSPVLWVYAAFPSRERPPAVRAFIDHVASRLDTKRWLMDEAAWADAT